MVGSPSVIFQKGMPILSRITKWLLALFLGLPVVLISLGAILWFCSPSFQEKVLLAGLLTGVHPIQKESLKFLRDYPTQTTAVSLVAFANLKYRAPKTRDQLYQEAHLQCQEKLGENSSEQELKECLQEVFEKLKQENKELEKERKKEAKLAEEAVRSLCFLTGHTFGTYFEKTQWGHSWGSLDDERWSQVLPSVNSWAFSTFGSGVVGVLGGEDSQ
jgi:hypothetical protein